MNMTDFEFWTSDKKYISEQLNAHGYTSYHDFNGFNKNDYTEFLNKMELVQDTTNTIDYIYGVRCIGAVTELNITVLYQTCFGKVRIPLDFSFSGTKSIKCNRACIDCISVNVYKTNIRNVHNNNIYEYDFYIYCCMIKHNSLAQFFNNLTEYSTNIVPTVKAWETYVETSTNMDKNGVMLNTFYSYLINLQYAINTKNTLNRILLPDDMINFYTMYKSNNSEYLTFAYDTSSSDIDNRIKDFDEKISNVNNNQKNIDFFKELYINANKEIYFNNIRNKYTICMKYGIHPDWISNEIVNERSFDFFCTSGDKYADVTKQQEEYIKMLHPNDYEKYLNGRENIIGYNVIKKNLNALKEYEIQNNIPVSSELYKFYNV